MSIEKHAAAAMADSLMDEADRAAEKAKTADREVYKGADDFADYKRLLAKRAQGEVGEAKPKRTKRNVTDKLMAAMAKVLDEEGMCWGKEGIEAFRAAAGDALAECYVKHPDPSQQGVWVKVRGVS